ncbi:RNA polymerase sigma factor (sigma-70 family) [Nocardiopsis sp. Huas11]|uniref:sigma-70 family RNA polymerase sigma factor n=1 Tax=Nocardiopsis sp. Huas11 TaxID=2183912 RepID=UPI000EB38426|nr:sigma-70 family RNA polymerase sigma factor [Nocardiopsis sp. Huas11]RKS06927.1 RNA polymerase sigma factor (sigma-70 family) [Nocardiopsis sp. Huas11]
MTDADGNHTEVLLGDAEIIKRVRSGDTGAYATLYERHAAASRGLARQLLRGDAEVEDAVAEAFTRVLSVIQRGAGPTDSFRPYLLTAVRNAAYDRGRGDKRQVVTDDMESYDSGEPFVDPALEGLERSLIARAFLSLPERWQSVLWHTEIEGIKPAEAAPILGMNANGVAALAYRAREGLRQAYLQMHLAGGAAPEACRPALNLLGAYVRGGLSKRDTAKVDGHMDGCADCREVYAELMDVNVGLRGVVLPIFVGVGAAGYLATTPGGAATGALWSRMSRRRQQVTAGAAAAAGMAVAIALALVGGQEPLREEETAPVAAPPGHAAPPDEPPPGAPADPPGVPPGAPADPPPGAPADPPAAQADAPEDADPPSVLSAVLPPADVPEDELPLEEAPGPLFAAGIDPVGALIPGVDGIMVLDVRNIGASTVEDVIALITLPPGVTMIADGGAGTAVPAAVGDGDWSCAVDGDGGRCVHAGMEAGQDGTQFFDVRVAPDADLGVPARVTVSSGDVTATATGERGVSPHGVAARYATAGRVRAESVGNALMTCVEPESPHWPWPWWGSGEPGVEPQEPPEVPGPGGQGEGDGDGTADEDGDGDLRRPPADPGGPLGLGQGETPGTPEQSDPPGADVTPQTPDHESDNDVPVPPSAPTAPSVPESDGSEVPEADEDAYADPSPPPAPEVEEGAADGPCAQARARQGDRRDNDHWEMAPLDRDWDPTTTASSSATWRLPEGGSVRWAGLYFSGAGAPDAATARIKGPGMASYADVAAAETRVAELPGYPAYQAFADVTDLVRAQGGGEWWVADVPAREGRAVYAGWNLLVVMEDPEVGSYNQTMVLDAAGAVFQDPAGLGFPVSGLLPSSVPAVVDVTAWEGDDELYGDQLTVDGRVLIPRGEYATGDNAFVGSARGAVGDPMAFGTDVLRTEPVLGRESELRVVSDGDAVLVGVVAVTAPMRT